MQAVVTISAGSEFAEMAAMTHPLLQDYARRVRADFVSLGQLTPLPHFDKFRLYDLLLIYDRIVYLDTDLIVTPGCPDLFSIVPPHCFGAWIASSWRFNHTGRIGRFAERLGSHIIHYAGAGHIPGVSRVEQIRAALRTLNL